MSIFQQKGEKTIQDTRVAVYTASIGFPTIVKDPVFPKPPNWDFFFFTDNPNLHSNYFQIVNVSRHPELDPNRDAKQYKLLPHKYFPDYDYSIWIDSSIALLPMFPKLAAEMFQYPAALFKHPERQSIYAEAEVIRKHGLADLKRLRNQMATYERENYPDTNPLAAGGVLFRHHNLPAIREFNELWFEQIIKFSKRDQLSFPYIEWKTGTNWQRIDKTIWDNNGYLAVIR